ncbi:MAG: phasin family protein [Alphaproteobacteria bacterium]|nr:phasin family protein [Alphaproteobacteria bacterium]
MSQPQKKPQPQPAAKLATNLADKAAKQAFDAAQSTRSSAENVVRIGSSAMQEFFTTSAGEAQKAQEKIFSMGREQAEQLAKSADSMTKMMVESVAMSRDNIETCVECGNMTASFAKDMSAEMMESANKAFADSVEMTKAFFACRTINDMMELQNRAAQSMIDNFFSQSAKYSNMFFEYSSDTLEPINERIAEATEQFSKNFSA